MLPSHLNLKFKEKGKETDGFINLMRNMNWSFDDLKKIPISSLPIYTDYFKRQKKN